MRDNKSALAQPQVIDGIEFYVSTDGSESGMSASGLAKFIGIDRKNIYSILQKLEGGNSEDAETVGESSFSENDVPRSLRLYTNIVFLKGVNGAKVIPSNLCESLIRYLAYESVTTTEAVKQKAESAHTKFAQFGLHKFILQAAGFVEQNSLAELKALLIDVLGEVQDLKHDSLELKSIRQSTVRLPGYDKLLDYLSSDAYQEMLLAPAEDGALSVEGWLYSKGISLTKPKFLSLTKAIAANFKAAVHRDPDKKHFTSPEGNRKYNVFVYKPEYFPILQMCLEEVTRKS